MAFHQPFKRYQPLKAGDGEGGHTETLGSALTVFGSIQVHQNKTSVLIDKYDDVKVGDIIAVAEEASASEAQYRVTDSELMSGTAWRRLSIERMARPIQPA